MTEINVVRRNDPMAKVQIVTFTDPDGTEQIVQHPLSKAGYNAQAIEAKVIAQMQASYERFHAAIGD